MGLKPLDAFSPFYSPFFGTNSIGLFSASNDPRTKAIQVRLPWQHSIDLAIVKTRAREAKRV